MDLEQTLRARSLRATHEVEELRGEIMKDLTRLHPGHPFFARAGLREAMLQILVVWAREHPALADYELIQQHRLVLQNALDRPACISLAHLGAAKHRSLARVLASRCVARGLVATPMTAQTRRAVMFAKVAETGMCYLWRAHLLLTVSAV